MVLHFAFTIPDGLHSVLITTRYIHASEPLVDFVTIFSRFPVTLSTLYFGSRYSRVSSRSAILSNSLALRAHFSFVIPAFHHHYGCIHMTGPYVQITVFAEAFRFVQFYLFFLITIIILSTIVNLIITIFSIYYPLS